MERGGVGNSGGCHIMRHDEIKLSTNKGLI